MNIYNSKSFQKRMIFILFAKYLEAFIKTNETYTNVITRIRENASVNRNRILLILNLLGKMMFANCSQLQDLDHRGRSRHADIGLFLKKKTLRSPHSNSDETFT